MSALRPKADSAQQSLDVRLGLGADILHRGKIAILLAVRPERSRSQNFDFSRATSSGEIVQRLCQVHRAGCNRSKKPGRSLMRSIITSTGGLRIAAIAVLPHENRRDVVPQKRYQAAGKEEFDETNSWLVYWPDEPLELSESPQT